MRKYINRQLSRRLCCVFGLVFGATAQVTAQEAAIIGSVTFQVGDTRLDRNGNITAITKGQTLKAGDRLLTGADGHVHARMIDNGFISVRPSARLHIKSYVYAPQEPGANRVGLMLESGVVRTISGKAGEAARENYRFNTPVAAIGLRGTDYVVQALPDTTRVSVSKGAITMSAFGPGCSLNALTPCTGPLVRELTASSPHAYMEVRAQGGVPVIVLPDNNKNAPNKAVPPRSEELRALVQSPVTTALTSEILNSPRTTAPPEPPQVPVSVPAPAPALAPLVTPLPVLAAAPTPVPVPAQLSVPPPASPRPEIAWGRWSNVALQDTPTLVSLATDDREITFGNALFGLLRPANSSKFPAAGIIGMTYKQGEAYLQTTQPGAAQLLTPAQLSNGSLQLDFNNRQFATKLSATAQGTTYELNAQGTIHSQGLLLVDPTRSNMNLAGALSNNAVEAGYLFDANVAPRQSLIGATRWGR
jgi:FecR protein